MATKSKSYKKAKKTTNWKLPLLLVLVLVAVGFGVFVVFFSRANTNSPQIYLTTNNSSAANAATNIGGSGGFTYGEPGDKIIACNWDGVNYGTTNVDTVGAYRPSTAQFFLNNNNGSNAASLSFTYGSPNDVPICGRWHHNPDNKATVGVFRNGAFYLANLNTNGGGTVDKVDYIGANGGDIPLACDWNGDGITDIGYYRPSEGKFYLYLWYGDYNHQAVTPFQYGPAGNLTRYPICGNWDGSATVAGQSNYDTVGFYDTTNGTFYLRNTNSASTDIAAGATVTKFADQNTLKLAPVVGRFAAGRTTFVGGYTITEKPAPAPAPTTTTTTSTAPAPTSTSAVINGSSVAECATKTLRRGNTGTCLSYLIFILRSKGYNVAQSELDSLTFGPDTESKVRAFQTAAGIGNDGVVGPITWGKLTATGSGSDGGGAPVLKGQTVGSQQLLPALGPASIALTCSNYNVLLSSAIAIYDKNVTLYDRVWTSPTGTWRSGLTIANRFLYTSDISKLKNLAINCDVNVNPYLTKEYIESQFSKYADLRRGLDNMTNLLNALPPLK